MYELIDGLEVSAVYYGANPVSVFAKGHHEPEPFAAAVTKYIATVFGGHAFDVGLPDKLEPTDDRIRLTWWRWVPAGANNLADAEPNQLVQYPAEAGKPGAFAVTVFVADPDYAVMP